MQVDSLVTTIDCKNVRCYLVKANDGYLMFDAGWPHQYREWKNSVRSLGINPDDIRYFIVSHFHIDHAGLAGILSQNGKNFFVFENQIDQIDEMEELIARKGYPYYKINRSLIQHKKITDSRAWLSSLGIDGEIVQTFGHGPQGIALILDNSEALIGDLPVLRDYDDTVKKDWQRLDAFGVKIIYPAHVGVYHME
ncbi:MBL fold metallo-hydrolase [candidate division WWE3 bacterium]|nr:MBL fold metallo-hydrolase [candidate division WWE3 bacterium]